MSKQRSIVTAIRMEGKKKKVESQSKLHQINKNPFFQIKLFFQEFKDYITLPLTVIFCVPGIPGGPLKSVDGLIGHDDGIVVFSAIPLLQCTRMIEHIKTLAKKCFILLQNMIAIAVMFIKAEN